MSVVIEDFTVGLYCSYYKYFNLVHIAYRSGYNKKTSINSDKFDFFAIQIGYCLRTDGLTDKKFCCIRTIGN